MFNMFTNHNIEHHQSYAQQYAAYTTGYNSCCSGSSLQSATSVAAGGRDSGGTVAGEKPEDRQLAYTDKPKPLPCNNQL